MYVLFAQDLPDQLEHFHQLSWSLHFNLLLANTAVVTAVLFEQAKEALIIDVDFHLLLRCPVAVSANYTLGTTRIYALFVPYHSQHAAKLHDFPAGRAHKWWII